MGLPVRQRRVLDHIDRALRGSDPRLAALYTIFGRLAQGEEMPRFEQLRSGVMAWLAVLGGILAAVGSRLHIRVRARRRVRVTRRVQVGRRVQAGRRLRARRRFRIPLRPRQRAILLYPLAIALTLGSIVLAARSGNDRTCLPVRAVAASKNVAKSSLCQSPGTVSPPMFGH